MIETYIIRENQGPEDRAIIAKLPQVPGVGDTVHIPIDRHSFAPHEVVRVVWAIRHHPIDHALRKQLSTVTLYVRQSR